MTTLHISRRDLKITSVQQAILKQVECLAYNASPDYECDDLILEICIRKPKRYW